MPFLPGDIKELRKREDLRHYELAVLVGVTPQTILNWQNEVSTPKIFYVDKLYRLAQERGHEDLIFYQMPRDSSI